MTEPILDLRFWITVSLQGNFSLKELVANCHSNFLLGLLESFKQIGKSKILIFFSVLESLLERKRTLATPVPITECQLRKTRRQSPQRSCSSLRVRLTPRSEVRAFWGNATCYNREDRAAHKGERQRSGSGNRHPLVSPQRAGSTFRKLKIQN
jgi:hypothetical protein